MNDIYNDNPDFDEMSTEELRKWTFSKRPESIPHKKGIFELNKRLYNTNLKTLQKTEKLTKWLVCLTIILVLLTIALISKEFF